jgi:trigger factor
METTSNGMKITINEIGKSEVEILGILEVAEFEKYDKKAIQRIGERLELPGFRKGKAPENVIREQANEMMILEEMAELALSDAYPKIIEEHKIDAIGRPQIAITKIAKGSDLEFKIHTAVLPKMKLPDYKKLAADIKKKNPSALVKVDEAEVEKTILDLRKMRAEQSRGAGAKHEGHENMTEEEHAKAHDIPESEYPALDDTFAKSFGNFENVEAFKEKIRGNMKIEKETVEKDKVRLLIVEDLIKETEGDIPEILIESETDKILYRLEADITNSGFKFEDYLAQIGKTVEELRKEWRADAEKRAKLQMIIHTISTKEGLAPTEEEIEKEVTTIVTMYKDADPMRARAYVENMLENEKVFNFLESQ